MPERPWLIVAQALLPETLRTRAGEWLGLVGRLEYAEFLPRVLRNTVEQGQVPSDHVRASDTARQ